MFVLLAILSIISTNEAFSFNPRIAASTRFLTSSSIRSTELNAIPKVKKADIVSSSSVSSPKSLTKKSAVTKKLVTKEKVVKVEKKEKLDKTENKSKVEKGDKKEKKGKKEDDVTVGEKKVEKKVKKERDGEREEMMIDVLSQTLEILKKGGENTLLMDLLDDMEGKEGSDRGSGYSSSLSSDQTELLNGVVRIYCTHSQPNFGMPWQRLKQEFSTSTGFVIDGNRILTNAHAVEYGSLIQVKKRSSEKKYVASVIAGELVRRN